MFSAKIWGRAPRLRLARLTSLLGLLPRLVCRRRLQRGRRSDGGVVARETRTTIHRHGHRSLRLRTSRHLAPRSTVAVGVGFAHTKATNRLARALPRPMRIQAPIHRVPCKRPLIGAFILRHLGAVADIRAFARGKRTVPERPVPGVSPKGSRGLREVRARPAPEWSLLNADY